MENASDAGSFKDRSSYFMVALLLGLSVAGVAAIYFASERIEPLAVSVEDVAASGVDGPLVGRLVRVDVAICNIRKSKSGTVYWSVADDAECAGNVMTVPVFDKKLKALSVAKGDTIGIIGTVDDYEGELEIVPKDVRLADGVADGD